jgi:hypothetical protein
MPGYVRQPMSGDRRQHLACLRGNLIDPHGEERVIAPLEP